MRRLAGSSACQSANPIQTAVGSQCELTQDCAQVTEQTPGVYVPQIGDRVVYLQQGHKLYHERLRDKRRGPWDTIVSTAVVPITQDALALARHGRQPWAFPLRHCLPCCFMVWVLQRLCFSCGKTIMPC